MLFEWLLTAATPCPPPLRALGYRHELIAIEARRRRCRAAWAEHLARSRAAILQAIDRTQGRGTAMVLGSGWQLDLPLAELAGAFRRVVLVDVIHPLAARWRARRWPNIDLIAADVTGVAAPLHALAAGAAPPTPRSFAPLQAPDLDLVVSLNLLSQVGVMPSEWLERSRGADAAQHYATLITQAHLDDLARCRAATCLISDVEMWSQSPAGAIHDRRSSIFDAAAPRPDEEWIWAIAPAPESDPVLSEYRRVICAYTPAR